MDELATTHRDLVALMRDYKKSGPTAECFDALDAIQARLDAAHEFPHHAESAESFSAILSKSVTAPIQFITAQLQTHHKAIQALTKVVDAAKPSRIDSSAASTATPALSPLPRPPKAAPLTSTPDERILLRCDGETPPIFALPFHELVSRVNKVLVPLELPRVACASRTKDGGLFLVPESKDAVKSLVSSWPNWGPTVFPGARIVPPAVYSHIQLDGIIHAAAPDLDSLAKELTDRYPELGPVVGSPVWVNKPPSEAQISATLSAGGKPRTAGSIFVRLGSREKVDIAVSMGRLRVAGSAAAVARGFPHLRVVQCWGCLKFGHTRARCCVKEPKCGGCGDKTHGPVCSSKPHCLNCGGDHRADAFTCPARKSKALALRQRAIELASRVSRHCTCAGVKSIFGEAPFVRMLIASLCGVLPLVCHAFRATALVRV
ncbi:hypothetical protein C8R46DRAFT_1037674 [Mycena filopes]|nr:hypothetical protein C8R46DRAFT_1037674 [Mycena filopes]